ncbi:tail assembly protein [Pseudomonas donghuensis]|uniref:tail assembly protein n=1 Tax=Pseudomonas donghuensis TaxID=1163398 RepID=UPI00215E80F5|nr:tail assembly protein [Pseudomonas donghuensis]UVL31833.1 tail assembly protein [Pseudomonas donghuensis]
MTTIASLGLRIDSGDAVEAANDLDKLADAGKRSEESAGKTGRAWESALSGMHGDIRRSSRSGWWIDNPDQCTGKRCCSRPQQRRHGAGSATPFGAPLIGAGIGLVAGGVIQMLSPQAKGLSQSGAPENLPSYAFGSAKNTTASGNPVPICIGERRWGGAIISASIYAEDKA